MTSAAALQQALGSQVRGSMVYFSSDAEEFAVGSTAGVTVEILDSNGDPIVAPTAVLFTSTAAGTLKDLLNGLADTIQGNDGLNSAAPARAWVTENQAVTADNVGECILQVAPIGKAVDAWLVTLAAPLITEA
jgi:hypothetical protein